MCCDLLVNAATEILLAPIAAGKTADSDDLLTHLNLHVPPLSARIRAYLTIGGGSPKTASVIFLPIEGRIARIADSTEGSDRLLELTRSLFASTENQSPEQLYELMTK